MQATNQVFSVKFYDDARSWWVTTSLVILGMFAFNTSGMEVSGLAKTAFVAGLIGLSVWLGCRLGNRPGRVELTETEIRLRMGWRRARVIQRANVESCAARISDDGLAKLQLRLRSGQRPIIVLNHCQGDATFAALAAALGADLARA
ncbi:hypothetical protein [Hymenobacter latericus]|uniref:hypothetical protein n=1 Tax=Hymenobacter sp. YIM 151858-1 TaxID=2987688 RepID=UPI00222637F7|nr:hypothetical protein [Hymenobacter sp. YIM 151858-1]UYZ59858.1 hypothetical protein OIS50_03460 [Hymenobacter sp. YIM 151858-1]